MIGPASRAFSARRRSGITLTEILISIMIMGVGMISLATLFPLGILRLREATRLSRSTFLVESAMAEIESRNLLFKGSFLSAITAPWYVSTTATPAGSANTTSYDPFVQDTQSAYANAGLTFTDSVTSKVYPSGVSSLESGLPVAYDPLWRVMTSINLDATTKPDEARFGSGLGRIRLESDGLNGGLPSAHGLQRITNFYSDGGNFAVDSTVSPVYVSTLVKNIFVSPEDYVFQSQSDGAIDTSPIVPLLPVDSSGNFLQPLNDFRYSWMFTGRQIDQVTSSESNLTGNGFGTTFEGDIVVFENRPFGLDPFSSMIDSTDTTTYYQATGEQVLEAVYGPRNTSDPTAANPYVPSRTVLLRWPAAEIDPDVRVGYWMADITYERDEQTAIKRFGIRGQRTFPAQRCHWYQIVKRSDPGPDSDISGYRSMTVYVNTPLKAVTTVNVSTASAATPTYAINAALISPHVVNVFPKTIDMK